MTSEFKTMDELIGHMAEPTFQHSIRRGETLSEIARRYNTTVREIARLNPEIKDVNRIVAGESLTIPNQISTRQGGLSMASDTDYLGKGKEILPTIDQNQGVAEASTLLEEVLPMLKPLGLLGAAAVPKAITALAGAMPKPLLQAGVPSAGQIGGAMVGVGKNAKPNMSNVRPYGSGNGWQGQNKMVTNAMLNQRPLANVMKPNPQRELATNARSLNTLGPQLYPGPMSDAVKKEALQQAMRKYVSKPISNGGRKPIGKLDDEASLKDLMREGRGQLQGAGGGLSFQELLRLVGYGK